MNIEVEVRSFINENQYQQLLEFFSKEANLIKEDYQESYYFDCPEDLRIQRNNDGAKIWLKKGEIHDDAREEIEIKVAKEDFENLEQLFQTLGYEVEIKWFRNRSQFKWDDIKVCIDYTKGYGHIIELEKICQEEDKEKEHQMLMKKLKSLNIEISSKKSFNEKFEYYKENWKSLIKA